MSLQWGKMSNDWGNLKWGSQTNFGFCWTLWFALIVNCFVYQFSNIQEVNELSIIVYYDIY